MKSRRHSGPLFRDVILDIIKKKSANNYLEVGVRDASTFRMVSCPSIGVDPFFDISSFPFDGKREVHFYQMSSDVFFRNHDPCRIFGERVDVVFLDGLHLFEYLLRDFINCERCCSVDSLIILDDCLPVDSEMVERQHRPSERSDGETASWWTGDVWKILPILQQYRPDLRVTNIDTSPTGSVFITNLDPKSNVLRKNYYSIVEEATKMHFDLSEFYDKIRITPALDVLRGLDFSIYAGP